MKRKTNHQGVDFLVWAFAGDGSGWAVRERKVGCEWVLFFNSKMCRDGMGKDSRTDIEESFVFSFAFFLRAVIKQSDHDHGLKATKSSNQTYCVKKMRMYIPAWPHRKRLQHPLLLPNALIPLSSYAYQRFQRGLRVNEHTCEDLGALGVKLVHELGDNTEVAATAADAEEEIVVEGWRGGVGDAGGRDHCRLEWEGTGQKRIVDDETTYLEEVIDYQAVFTREPAIATSKSEPTYHMRISIFIKRMGERIEPSDSSLL
jgi:hypothetical protein